MKALAVTRPVAVGELPGQLSEIEMPLPEPGPGEVRVRVLRATINIDDIHIAEGSFIGGIPTAPRPTLEAPLVPGTELAGLVDAVGPDVADLSRGQQVFGISRPKDRRGPWAGYTIAAREDLGLYTGDPNAIVGLPLSGSVVVDCLRAAGDLAGRRCLVIGASGGIGMLTVQALHASGAQVWAVGSASKAKQLRDAGADTVLDRHRVDFAQALQDGETQMDVVFDFVGGADTEARAFSVLKRGGSFITAVGPEAWIGSRRLSRVGLLRMFAGIAWRTLSSRLVRGRRYRLVSFKRVDFTGLQDRLIRHGIRIPVDSTIPLRRKPIIAALERVVAHRTTGRVVIEVDGVGSAQQ